MSQKLPKGGTQGKNARYIHVPDPIPVRYHTLGPTANELKMSACDKYPGLLNYYGYIPGYIPFDKKK